MTSAIAVAQAFLDLAAHEGRSLTNMKLQKLVFFAHGVHLAAYDGSPLIEDPIRAWDFGPVIPPLYEKLRRFGKGTVDPTIAPAERTLDPDGSEFQAIRSVWEAYKAYDAWSLSRITHQPGSPWSKIWEACKYDDIPNEVIREYYQGRVKRKNVAPA
jgi:uncharacterized phage-associated protein